MIGGGLAGLSAAVALADSGLRVRLHEQRPFLGGRATSYALPDGSFVDNCQHVTLGCCTNLDDFYRRVGAQHLIHYYDSLFFVDKRGRNYSIHSSALPPPFHMAPSFARFSALTFADKRSIATAMLAIARSGGRPSYAERSTMLTWLHRMNQTPAAIDRFWRVVLVSALDEELARTDARYGIEVFWKAFLANREGYRVGIPSVPLSELYQGCREAIEARGGEVHTRSTIRELRIENGRVASIGATNGGSSSGGTDENLGNPGEAYILNVPRQTLLDLVGPEIAVSDPAFRGLPHIQDSPITGVHLWFDRPVMNKPFLTLLDHTVQWIFNKKALSSPALQRSPQPNKIRRPSTQQSAVGPTGAQHLQLVISASYDLVARSRPEIVEMCLRELGEILPEIRRANLVKSTVIKEIAATFSPAPGVDEWRPSARCSIKNMYLAGDYVQTGWPATMEGAVRSGYLAAEALLSDSGKPVQFIRPDLAPEGLSAHWARKADRANAARSS